jgi:hypothetical protein
MLIIDCPLLIEFYVLWYGSGSVSVIFVLFVYIFHYGE